MLLVPLSSGLVASSYIHLATPTFIDTDHQSVQFIILSNQTTRLTPISSSCIHRQWSVHRVFIDNAFCIWLVHRSVHRTFINTDQSVHRTLITSSSYFHWSYIHRQWSVSDWFIVQFNIHSISSSYIRRHWSISSSYIDQSFIVLSLIHRTLNLWFIVHSASTSFSSTYILHQWSCIHRHWSISSSYIDQHHRSFIDNDQYLTGWFIVQFNVHSISSSYIHRHWSISSSYIDQLIVLSLIHRTFIHSLTLISSPSLHSSTPIMH